MVNVMHIIFRRGTVCNMSRKQHGNLSVRNVMMFLKKRRNWKHIMKEFINCPGLGYVDIVGSHCQLN